MKTAEEVADGIMRHRGLGKEHQYCSRAQAIADITAFAFDLLKEDIVYAIIEFNKERREELAAIHAIRLKEARVEALEDAAKVCENPKGEVSRDYIRYAKSTAAPEIRALKDRKP